MFEVINSLREEMEKVPVRVSQKCIDNAANSGLETVLVRTSRRSPDSGNC